MRKILREVFKWAVFATAIYFRIFDPLHIEETYTRNVVQTIVNFIIFVFGAKLLLQIIGYYLRKSDYPAINIRLGLRNLYYIFVAFAVVMLGLSLVGIDYRALFTAVSIVAAAIAITMKDFIAEIICGIILSFSRRVLVNDYVKIGEMKGKVLDMGLHKITFINEDDDIIFIPNSKVYNNEIINYTQSDQSRINIDFQMPLNAVDNFEDFETDLFLKLQDVRDKILDNSFTLRITNMTKDIVDFKLSFTAIGDEPEQVRELRRLVTRRLLNYIRSKSAQTASGQPQDVKE